jgi:hypothetical protein
MSRPLSIVPPDTHVPARRRAAIGLAWALAWTLAWGLAIFGFAHRSHAAEPRAFAAQAAPR